ncbi:MAG: hypothetical protein HW421_2459 [Ignavibacteria bacterium]|nr:hypothetical protein [Ignavibacteria bacterium]
MKTKIIQTMAVIILLLSCKENSSSPSNQSNFIIPLKIGNSWNSKITELGSNGLVISTLNETDYILKDTVIGMHKVYCMKTIFNGIDNNLVSYGLNKNDGLYSINIENGKVNEYLWYKYPCKVGDIYFRHGDTVKVEATDVEITVPAGKFRCVKYHLYHEFPSYFYLCPGIGPVKQEHFEYDSKGKLYMNGKIELISYSLK